MENRAEETDIEMAEGGAVMWNSQFNVPGEGNESGADSTEKGVLFIGGSDGSCKPMDDFNEFVKGMGCDDGDGESGIRDRVDEDGIINDLREDFERLEKPSNMVLEPKSLFGVENFDAGASFKTPEQKGLVVPFKAADRKKYMRMRCVIMSEIANRLRQVERSHDALELEVKLLREKVKEFEGEKVKGDTRMFSRDDLMNYILEAIRSCTTGIGCSKAYIKKFLCERFEVPISAHYVRKIGMLLSEAVMQNKIQFDPKHNLYKL